MSEIGLHQLSVMVLNRLSEESNWNHTGGYAPGKSCIITAAFGIWSDHGFMAARESVYDRYRYIVRNIIKSKFGNRFDDRYGRTCIIDFNDDPDTTHALVVEVLTEAVERATPWHVKLMNLIRAQ